MDNRELLSNLIEVEIKKLKHNEYLDNENKIKQEKENIKQKVFSIGLIDKSNKNQIEKSINLLYQQHHEYYEFIYHQIKVLGDYFHDCSNNILINIIEEGIQEQGGSDFE